MPYEPFLAQAEVVEQLLLASELVAIVLELTHIFHRVFDVVRQRLHVHIEETLVHGKAGPAATGPTARAASRRSGIPASVGLRSEADAVEKSPQLELPLLQTSVVCVFQVVAAAAQVPAPQCKALIQLSLSSAQPALTVNEFLLGEHLLLLGAEALKIIVYLRLVEICQRLRSKKTNQWHLQSTIWTKKLDGSPGLNKDLQC